MQKIDDKIAPFLFIFLPFLAFLVAIKDLSKKNNAFVFIAFSALFGYAMSFTYAPSDSYRIAASFCTFPITSISDIEEMWQQGRLVDVYLILLNFVTHIFSDNPKVFYSLLGAIYGLFCCMSLKMIIQEKLGGDSKYLAIVLFLFFTTASLANMSMPRFWTAAWVFFYSASQIIKNKNKWFIGIFCSLLIHFSFIAPVVILLTYKLIRRSHLTRIKFLSECLVITFFLSFCINGQVLQKVIPDSVIGRNEKLDSKMSAYLGENNPVVQDEDISAYRKANNLVTQTFHLLMKIGAFGVLIFIVRRRTYLNIDENTNTLLLFSLIFASFVFILSTINAVGWRYVWLLWLFLLYLIYRIYDQNRYDEWKNIIKILVPLNIYNIAFMFYLTYRVVDLTLFWGSLPYIIYDGYNFGPVKFIE